MITSNKVKGQEENSNDIFAQFLRQKQQVTEQQVHSATSLPKDICGIVAEYTTLYCNDCALKKSESTRSVRFFIEESLHVDFVARQHLFNAHSVVCCQTTCGSYSLTRQLRYYFPQGSFGINWALPTCSLLCPNRMSQHKCQTFVEYIGNAKHYSKYDRQWNITWKSYHADNDAVCKSCKASFNAYARSRQ